MAKDEQGLIEKAINAAHEFEELMDSIDFNSYLEDDEDNKDIKGYDQYKEKLGECKNKLEIIREIDIVPSELFLAKGYRLEARTQNVREQEEKHYIEAISETCKGLDSIPLEKLGDQKDKKLSENFNWLKVLYYNELAICYSGLAKSSMSLGYAELSTSLLEEIRPELKDIGYPNRQSGKHNIEEKSDCYPNRQIVKLYTFALYNKGEAEKLLHDSNSALKIFCQIIEICKTCNKEAEDNSDKISASLRKAFILNDMGRGKEAEDNSDKISASLRKAFILNDMGRGKEAIGALREIYGLKPKEDVCEEDVCEEDVCEEDVCEEVEKIINGDAFKDYRMLEAGLEVVSIYIDKKEYKRAYDMITLFTENVKLEKTFIQRKAKVYLLRLMNEFKKNRTEDCEITIKHLPSIKQQTKLKYYTGISCDKESGGLKITLELAEDDFNKFKEEFIKEFCENASHKKEVRAIEDAWGKLHPDEYKGIKDKYPKLKENVIKILHESYARKDRYNFKKTCIYLVEYYRHIKKDYGKAFKYSCLYLYAPSLDENNDKIIDEWLGDKSLEDLLTKYNGDNNELVNKLDKIENISEDEKYLRNFFDLFFDECKKKGKKSTERNNITDAIIEKLKDKLVHIYGQKGNDYKIEEVEKKYRLCSADSVNSKENGDSTENKYKKIARQFIKKYFFIENTKEDIENLIKPNSIVERIKKNTGEFAEKVAGKSIPTAKNGEEIIGRLCILRRWNSFTPNLRSSVNASKGGGYFLYFSVLKDNDGMNSENTFGIVVDPGYNFLENFFSQGFKIGDIDVVLVSHMHPDHTNDLPVLLTLFHEMNGRLGIHHYGKEKNKKNFTLAISPGVFEHYRKTIKLNEEHFKDIIVVRAEEGKSVEVHVSNLRSCKIKICAFGTAHKDLSEYQSLGFKIIVEKKDGSKTQIGFTGDTKWDEQWSEHLKECNIICAHLGAIVNVLDEKNFYNTFCKHMNDDNECTKNKNENKKCTQLNSCVEVDEMHLEKQTQDENHLYLAGLASFFSFLYEENSKLQIAIISEFGEELKDGMRMDLYRKFDKWFETELLRKKNGSAEGVRAICLPGDIGLEIDVFKGNVYCHCCGRYVERDRIEPVPYGKEEAICFVCKECHEILSAYQIGEKLKNYCENGRTSR